MGKLTMEITEVEGIHEAPESMKMGGRQALVTRSEAKLDDLAAGVVEDIKAFEDTGKEFALAVGSKMLEASAVCKSKEKYGKWLDNKVMPFVSVGKPQLLRYKQVAQSFGDNPEVVSAHSLTALVVLAEPGNAPVVDDVLSALPAGATVKEVKEAVTSAMDDMGLLEAPESPVADDKPPTGMVAAGYDVLASGEGSYLEKALALTTAHGVNSNEIEMEHLIRVAISRQVAGSNGHYVKYVADFIAASILVQIKGEK